MEKVKFLYLVQGHSSLLPNYFHLRERPSSAVIILSYDQQLEGCLYYPNSTWAEGRNRLLEQAKSLGYDFEYLIYCDDDLDFYYGSWTEFEIGLETFKPSIAVPVFDRTTKTVVAHPMLKIQGFTFNDEQLMAFSKEVVNEGKVLPYNTDFDALHWWATCRWQQILIQHYYAKVSLQFNFVRVANLAHERYEVSTYDDSQYKVQVLDWLRSNVDQTIQDINKSPGAGILIARALSYLLRHGLIMNKASWGSLFHALLRKLRRRKVLTKRELLAFSQGKGNIAIYGFGTIGKEMVTDVKAANGQIKLIVDKLATQAPYSEAGETVQSPLKLIEANVDLIFVASDKYWDDISFYLLDSLMLDPKKLFFFQR